MAPKVSKPEEGSQLRRTEKNRIKSTPNQKTGMEIPTMAKIIVMESNHEYCFIAEIIPKGIPRMMAMNIEKAANFNVAGKTVIISLVTGRFVI